MKKWGKVGNSHTYDMEKLYARLLVVSQHIYIHLSDLCRQALFSAQYVSLVAEGFRCKRCDGTIKEADITGDLVVDGETYECVKSFSFLGDTLDGDDGADLAATT